MEEMDLTVRRKPSENPLVRHYEEARAAKLAAADALAKRGRARRASYFSPRSGSGKLTSA